MQAIKRSRGKKCGDGSAPTFDQEPAKAVFCQRGHDVVGV